MKDEPVLVTADPPRTAKSPAVPRTTVPAIAWRGTAASPTIARTANALRFIKRLPFDGETPAPGHPHINGMPENFCPFLDHGPARTRHPA
jgi:hypothetical protein